MFLTSGKRAREQVDVYLKGLNEEVGRFFAETISMPSPVLRTSNGIDDCKVLVSLRWLQTSIKLLKGCHNITHAGVQALSAISGLQGLSLGGCDNITNDSVQ